MIAKIKNYFLSAYEELKKVVWPSRKEVTSHTIIIILSVAISMALIAIIDIGLDSLIRWLVNQRTI
jgi:preprotein translocase subunit SecE